MKYYLIIFTFVLSFISHSQTIEKNVGDFSTVKVFDLIHLKMISSDENKVVISGENSRNVEVVNNNGTLKIRMNFREIFDGNQTNVTLYYNNIDVIDANEGANITVNDQIKQYEIDLSVQEGGEITAEVETTYANYKAVTGGIINVTGSSKHQDISIYTGGVFNGKDFITDKTEVSINAAGEAYIHANTSVDAKVKAGGTVYIYGNPTDVDESTLLGGRIKRM
ncbi:head GIN domain-containing protein [Winogradskyella bathintestinalis]|uniref:Head GIN domain-containing protein n=1 Tax=Winogradskyella bathintestinalis TaxID=3035208 RepID=A0ABT7ZR99_9FLAO|nr:head GIN domain-containing protein [Winogradskyella bathintestinalis]MDN3491535.1 head GIN domain-containing protein [Winogradskyella bathintestinalis]